MKRIFICLVTVLSVASASAQSFDHNLLSYTTLSTEMGDLDGDGDMDIVSGGPRHISWEENIGGGNFVNHVINQYIHNTQNLFVVDMDQDGHKDILATSPPTASNTLSAIVWFRNDGQQNFTNYPITYTAGGAFTAFPVDLDGDGDIDVVSAGTTSGEVYWYRNNGLQGFTKVTITTGQTGITTIAAHDFDGDGDVDIIAGRENGAQIIQLTNDGAENFATSVLLAINTPRFLKIKDIDGDGDMDLFYSGQGGWGFFRNNGGALVQHPFGTGGGVRGMDVADMDNDGLLDIAYCYFDEGDVYWMKNAGNGTYSGGGMVDSNLQFSRHIHCHDFNSDGFVDVVAAGSYMMRFYPNNPTQTFTKHNINLYQSSARNACHGDFDGDGDIDMMSAGYFSIILYKNDGTGQMRPEWVSSSDNSKINVSEAVYISAVDMDDDGDLDAAFTEDYGGKVCWLENLGNGYFTKHIIANLPRAYSLDAVDFDNDGDMDLLVTSISQSRVCWYQNNGSQEFTQVNITASYGSPFQVRAVDYDGDGDMDVIAAHGGNSDKIMLHRNNGNNTAFTNITLENFAYGANSVFYIDLDQDGDIDFLSASSETNRVTWHSNNGNGTFTNVVVAYGVDGATFVYADDYDGDGDIDVISTSMGDWCAYIHINNGSQVFAPKVELVGGVLNAQFIASGDIDSDGKPDIYMTSKEHDKVLLLKNLGVVTETPIEPCTELFFSEYIHGTNGNAALEIYNPTPYDINLTPYQIYIYEDGYTSAGLYLVSGVVPAFGTYVIADPGSQPALLALADLTLAMPFNGNDVIVLMKNGREIDAIGSIDGEFPGWGWIGEGISTYQRTLVRKPTVSKGDEEPFGGFNPGIEWINYDVNTFSNLRAHTSDCADGCVPTVLIAASTNGVCPGTTITFTATGAEGGTTPVYQWKKNGNNVGANSPTYTDATLQNNDVIRCVMTSNAECALVTNVNSNQITMNILPVNVPTITVSPSATNVCTGTSVTFTATITNGGTTPVYQWKRNGSNVGSNSATYSNSTLTSSDIITCTLTSNAACPVPSSVTSSNVSISVSPNLTPSLLVEATSTQICAGTSVTFTATPTNGGTTPSYQWKRNNNNVGTNSPTYTNAALVNNDVISCVMTSNESCLTNTTATGSVTMTVTQVVNPTVVISVSGNGACAGQPVTFNATAYNGGPSPSFQWKVNGSNQGTNSNSFISSTLNNGDIVTCVITGSAACGQTTFTSNAITVNLQSAATPTIAITTPSTSICNGASATFTLSATNGGANPSYQWKKNGNNVGTGATTYTDNGLQQGDVITCVITSSSTCASTTVATSNAITMNVQASVTPSVAISTTNTTVCAGTSVVFTATPNNGGTTPSYQWKRNGTNVGSNSPNYTTSTLTSGDVITCVMTSNASCVSPATATSNSITMTVSPNVTPTISIVASSATICVGTSIAFTATTTNAGVSPVYQWKRNGNNVGTNQAIYTASNFQNNDVITCTVTGSLPCGSSTVASNAIGITVNQPVTPSVSISTQSTTVCTGNNAVANASVQNGGNSPSYQWYRNGSPVGSNASSYNFTPNNGDVITCTVTSNAACTSTPTATSNTITYSVVSQAVPAVTIVASVSEACEGEVVVFTATPQNGGSNPTYQWKVNGFNMGGNSNIFETNDLVSTDVLTCVMTSSLACVTSNSVTSNAVSVTINQVQMPTLSIQSSGNAICDGVETIFTANVANNSGEVFYSWYINNDVFETNQPVFSSTDLNNGDVVFCLITGNTQCGDFSVNSNSVTMTVYESLYPTMEIIGPDLLCEGVQHDYFASYSDVGNSFTFRWYINDELVSEPYSGFLPEDLQDGDVIHCVLIIQGACAFPQQLTSDDITVSIITLETPVITNVDGTLTTAFIEGAYYKWYFNGDELEGETTNTLIPTENGNYYVVVYMETDLDFCTSEESVSFDVIFISVEEITTQQVQIFPNPARYDITIQTTQQLKNVTFYNSLGELIWTTREQHIDISSLAQGVYTLRIEAGNEIFMERLVIQK
jgi:hypothetical protein